MPSPGLTGRFPDRSFPRQHDSPTGLFPEGLFLDKGSPYSITKRKLAELIPVLGSQPAGDASHKPGGRLPLLSARPADTLATS